MSALVSPVAGIAYEVAGFALCAIVATVSTIAVVALAGVPPGVALFAGLYQLPIAIPVAVIARKRAPPRLVRGFFVAVGLYGVVSALLATLIALGMLAA